VLAITEATTPAPADEARWGRVAPGWRTHKRLVVSHWAIQVDEKSASPVGPNAPSAEASLKTSAPEASQPGTSPTVFGGIANGRQVATSTSQRAMSLFPPQKVRSPPATTATVWPSGDHDNYEGWTRVVAS